MGTPSTVARHASTTLRGRWITRDEYLGASTCAMVLLAAAAVFSKTGVPKTPLMWPMYRVGVVLPSCGLTRAVTAVFRGDLHRAWMFNPASFLVVAVAAALTLRLVIGIATGHWIALPSVAATPRFVLVLLAAATAGLWINQQAHAGLLMHAMR